MLSPVEEVFLDFLIENIRINPSWKIAIVGEIIRNKRHNELCAEMMRRRKKWDGNILDFRNIQIFTSTNRFKVKDGERFDLIIGCRACGAEEIILESVQTYQKRVFIMPCTCGRIPKKVINYIRKYPIITRIEAGSSKRKDGTYKKYAWIFLFNVPFQPNTIG